MPERVELVPSAERLVNSLRDIGYDAPTAVADLVDNSIAAHATAVTITIAFDGADSYVRVADNGHGMSDQQLREALRYGSRRDYADGELGKFGLGLKTASFSQCRMLTVATRQTGSPDVLALRWDLDHIITTNSWEALRLSPKECRREGVMPLGESSGTVVMWEHLDRVAAYRDPEGGWAREGMARMCRDVEVHLGVVFHRFLTGEAKRRLPLQIYVNDNPVAAWDPFARAERATQECGRQILRFEHDRRTHAITVSPYILPNEADFSDALAHVLAGGPKRWNAQQGFYIYRNNRMIQSGGWDRIRALDEHTKLARIAIDFTSSSDSAFGINVAKMRVTLPEGVRKPLTAIVSGVTGRANALYRRKGDSGRGVVHSTGGTTGGGRRSPPPRVEPRQEHDQTLSNAGALLAETVYRVLVHELGDEPATLQRVLNALAVVRPEFHDLRRRSRTASA